MSAAERGHTETVQALVRAEADLTLLNEVRGRGDKL
jgi:hypothetical protein